MMVAIEELALVLIVVAGLAGFVLGRLRREHHRHGGGTAREHPQHGGGTEDARVAALATLRGAERDANERARRVVAIAMERCAAEVVSCGATATIQLASEDLKGRLIGREGRNHRTFERAAGVDLLIEEDACAVTVSTLDPVRREVARRSIEALLQEGRIQPSRIEEVVERERQSLDGQLPQIGEEAAGRAGVRGLSQPVLRALGALRFRTSASQSVLEHSIECAALAAHIAAEIGADAPTARRAALLHDIGKGLGGEWEGPHALSGMAFLKAQGEQDPVLHAVGAHHRDIEPTTDLASCVIVADSVSGARPGARRADLASLLERVGVLEELARAFPGVEQAYAVQAGRDLRVIVRPDALDELGAAELANAIVRSVEEHPTLRGPVHVTVIRETRHEADAG